MTRNRFGTGEVTYIGFMPSDAAVSKMVEESVRRAGLWGEAQVVRFPTVVRSGVLANGKAVHSLLNYSAGAAEVKYGFGPGKDLLSGAEVPRGGTVALPAWGVAIVEEGAR